MATERRRAVLGVGLGVHLLGLGFLGGIAVERMRFGHQRVAVLKRYDEVVRHWNAYLFQLEQVSPAGREADEGPWSPHLRKVDEALAERNVSAAERAWQEAYLATLRSPRWEGMVELGDAYLRIGEAAGGRQFALLKARERYLAALLRARQQGSLGGVLRTAEAFAALGDRALVDESLRIAEEVSAKANDPEARERVRVFAQEMAARFRGAAESDATKPVGQARSGTPTLVRQVIP